MMHDKPRYVRIAPKTVVAVGSLAGQFEPHPYIPDSWTGSCCMACFAPRDAAQHMQRRYVRTGRRRLSAA